MYFYIEKFRRKNEILKDCSCSFLFSSLILYSGCESENVEKVKNSHLDIKSCENKSIENMLTPYLANLKWVEQEIGSSSFVTASGKTNYYMGRTFPVDVSIKFSVNENSVVFMGAQFGELSPEKEIALNMLSEMCFYDGNYEDAFKKGEEYVENEIKKTKMSLILPVLSEYQMLQKAFFEEMGHIGSSKEIGFSLKQMENDAFSLYEEKKVLSILTAIDLEECNILTTIDFKADVEDNKIKYHYKIHRVKETDRCDLVLAPLMQKLSNPPILDH